MIRSITVTNYLGESMKLDLSRPELSGFIVENITGIGPGKAEINVTDMSTTDGGRFNSARLPKRNIVISLRYYYWMKRSIEDTRRLTYRYFPIKRNLTLKIETDSRTVEIEGYVESNEPNIFSKEEGADISIVCPEPFLYSAGTKGITTTIFSGTYPKFKFPFSSGIKTATPVPLPGPDFERYIRFSPNADGSNMTTEMQANSKYVGIGYMPKEVLEHENLYTGTKDFSGNNWERLALWLVTPNGYESFAVAKRTEVFNGFFQRLRVYMGEKYTFSALIRGASTSLVDSAQFYGTAPAGNIGDFDPYPIRFSPTGEWERVYFTTTVIGNDIDMGIRVEPRIADNLLEICAIKVERGPEATPWTPAPSDWLADPTNFTWVEILSKPPTLLMGDIQNNAENLIIYNGDWDTGIVIKIHAIGPASGVAIYNLRTREQMKIDSDKIVAMTGSGIDAGDDITITTLTGKKTIILTRNGVDINILNCLERESDWLRLVKGDNIIAYTAETGATNLQFLIENKTIYEGV